MDPDPRRHRGRVLGAAMRRERPHAVLDESRSRRAAIRGFVVGAWFVTYCWWMSPASGRRAVSDVFACRSTRSEWVLYAEGVGDGRAATVTDLSVWPPVARRPWTSARPINDWRARLSITARFQDRRRCGGAAGKSSPTSSCPRGSTRRVRDPSGAAGRGDRTPPGWRLKNRPDDGAVLLATGARCGPRGPPACGPGSPRLARTRSRGSSPTPTDAGVVGGLDADPPDLGRTARYAAVAAAQRPHDPGAAGTGLVTNSVGPNTSAAASVAGARDQPGGPHTNGDSGAGADVVVGNPPHRHR